jgi:hypothetical protein
VPGWRMEIDASCIVEDQSAPDVLRGAGAGADCEAEAL